MTFHQDVDAIASAVRQRLETNHVIVSLRSSEARKYLAIKESTQRVRKRCPVVVITNSRDFADRVRIDIDTQTITEPPHGTGRDEIVCTSIGRVGFPNFRQVSPDEFRRIAHDRHTDIFRHPDNGLLIMLDYDLLSVSDRRHIKNGLDQLRDRYGKGGSLAPRLLIITSLAYDATALARSINATRITPGRQ